MTSNLAARLVASLLFATAVAVPACGSDDGGGAAAGTGGTAGTGGGSGGGDSDAGTGATSSGGGDGGTAVEACKPDTSGAVPDRPNPGIWVRVEIEGAVCSNGSPYPIFVNTSNTSNNLEVYFEPGGACWDYSNCSPDGGLRGAANPNGIPPDVQHMNARNGAFPLLRKTLDDNPLRDWNMVFVPYCTGDLHTGNSDQVYTGPNGEKLTYLHHGHDNVQKVIKWIKENFQDIPQLLVDGCSAGGAGAIVNYHFIREGLGAQAQCSYLLDDSGPIFPNSGYSKPVQDKIREAWNVDPILDSLDGKFPGVSVDDIKADFGVMNTALADMYPKDRLSVVLYRWDLNYSVYSYGPFYNFPDYKETHRMWEADIKLLTDLYDTRSNLAYFIPNWRVDNCSHCLTIPAAGLDIHDYAKAISTPWMDSDLQTDTGDITLQDYVRTLLDDSKPLPSYFEDPPPAADGFTDTDANYCMGL